MTEINPSPENAGNSENEAFKKTLEESKARIQLETSLGEQLVPKRGRGRPRKHPGTPEIPIAPAVTQTVQAAEPAPDIAPLIKAPIQALSRIPAINYKIPELAFTDDEASMCAESLNQVIQAFVPDIGKMDPKTAAVVGAISVFGSIGFQKYSILQEKRRLASQEKPPEVQEQVAKVQESSGIPAGEYFQRTVG